MYNIFSIIGEQLLVSILLYGIYILLFEREAMFVQNRMYLICALGVILSTPFLSLEWIPNYIYVDQPIVNTSRPTLVPNSIVAVPIQEEVNYALLIFKSIYLIGFLIVVIRLFFQIVSIYRLNVRGKLVTRCNTAFCLHKDIDSPFSFFNRIYSTTDQLPEEILQHEKVHIQHLHTLDNIVLEICKALMWYNPFVYLFQRRLKEVHEYTCDYITAKKINNVPAYAQFLLEFNSIGPTPVLVNSFHSQIKKRLLMLKNSGQSNSSTRKKYLAVPILFALFLGFNVESYSIVKISNSEEAYLGLDTIPHSEFTVVDTLVVFDDVKFDETFYSIRRPESIEYNSKAILNHKGPKAAQFLKNLSRDTMITYNEKTYKEDVRIFEDVQNECYELKFDKYRLSVSTIEKSEVTSFLGSDIKVEMSSNDCRAFTNYTYNVYMQLDNDNWEILDREIFEQNKKSIFSVVDDIQSIIIGDIRLQYQNETVYAEPLGIEYHINITQ